MRPVAILAGGLAKRLHPTTLTIPKALVSVAGEPFIAHQLRLLRRKGVEKVVLCLGHLGEQVVEYIGNGRLFDIEVAYSFDGERLLGTGGALRRALPLLGEYFFVLYGDSYLDIALSPILTAFERSGAPALMTVFKNSGRWDTSNVAFDGRKVCYSKRRPTPDMDYIDYGLSILTDKVLLERPDGAVFDLADVYERLSLPGRLAGYEVTRRFFEIGTEAGRSETEKYLLEEAMAVSAYTKKYYEEVASVASGIDQESVDKMIDILVKSREAKGRLFILGVGGGAGHASHAVNDFRKICGIEAYTPTDNVSELTARINDDGWETAFANWLRGSRIRSDDVVLVFSVGGGSLEKNISANIVESLKLAQQVGAKIIGVVGRDGGYTRQVADACVVVPTVNHATVTPHTEAFQAVVWHGLVSHPRLIVNEMKWESVR